MSRFWTVVAVLACLSGALAPAAVFAASKPRVIVISDIGNEPDDSESLVRFLLYANEMDVEGLIASTSTWQRDIVHPEMMREIVEGYGRVVDHLRVHASGYPAARDILSRIRAGRPEYGMQGVGAGKETDASRLIIETVDKADVRPVWITVWSGATDLAQALWTVRQSRTEDQVRAFIAKLRVTSTSDQDDAGPWIRRNFPDLFWVVSLHAFNQYLLATWTGISGDLIRPSGGPDTSLVTNEWIAEHIRKGPLGELYPPHKFIMEGDTPTFLNLIDNGLDVPEHPDYGGWGGRYGKISAADGLYTDTADTVVGTDGSRYRTNQATIWRWRKAVQNDFAARIRWTLTSAFKDANHAPIAVLNGQEGNDPVRLSARSDQEISLSAEGSHDSNGTHLSYRWWVYNEIGIVDGPPLPLVTIPGDDQPAVKFIVPKASVPAGKTRELHVILEVWNDGEPPMVSYRRAILMVSSE